ncbi:unnamed protein product [Gongylonema pulchrum]|uniref:SF1-HH domain-containing protein n=1 Tax=Gongylonema pulchrum TaxID=637853 RepID=A0A183EVC5_9BILA|nr:unnamed protein product [Gongylonema pulchrum]
MILVGKLSSSGVEGAPAQSEIGQQEKKPRKSRWSTNKSFVPGMPTILPSNLSDDQRQAYLLQLEVEDATRKLRLGDFMGNPDPALRFINKRAPFLLGVTSSDRFSSLNTQLWL